MQQTLATHGIYTALSVNEQVVAIVADTLCYIQYHVCGATHMQLYAIFLELISMSNPHAHSNLVNKIPTLLLLHLSTDDVC